MEDWNPNANNERLLNKQRIISRTIWSKMIIIILWKLLESVEGMLDWELNFEGITKGDDILLELVYFSMIRFDIFLRMHRLCWLL